MIAYEQLLNRDVRWAFQEGSMHFEKESAVHRTLTRVARRLEALGVPYAVAGGMAMFFHGFRRFTEDVDVLVTPEGLREIHLRLEELGYLPLLPNSKNLRDTDTGVRIEFLVAGNYPGDGRPKPVTLPDPSAVGVEIDGMQFVQLPRLVELKLASGMTNPGRLRDLGDVQDMIATLALPADFATHLHPFVQEKYRELWTAVSENQAEP